VTLNGDSIERTTLNNHGDYVLCMRPASPQSRYTLVYLIEGGFVRSDEGCGTQINNKRLLALQRMVYGTVAWTVTNAPNTSPSSGGFDAVTSVNELGVFTGQHPFDNKMVFWNSSQTSWQYLFYPGTHQTIQGVTLDINNYGDIVGCAGPNGNGSSCAQTTQAYLYSVSSNHALTGLLGQLSCLGSSAKALNDSQVIVMNGFNCGNAPKRAMRNTHGVSQFLDELIPANSRWKFTEVIDINNKGQILAKGTRNGVVTYGLLTPNN
jgi:hypothetical protein